MKVLRLASLIFAVSITTKLVAQQTPKSSTISKLPIEGIWEGKLDLGIQTLRIVLRISAGAGKTYTVLMESPDQSAQKIAVSKFLLNNGDIHVEVDAVKVNYDGKISADGTSISGTFKQSGTELPLKLTKVTKASAFTPKAAKSQEPKKPYPYRQREVSYENKTGGVHIEGTLTIPQGPGPFPAVLMITGSGAQDRDESLLGHKPFLVISDYLTRKGIAVLRVDDRGVGGSTGLTDQSTTMDFVTDVLTGVEFLKQQKEVDIKNIGLIGHSEGGLIAPIAATKSTDVAFIVMLAGPGVSGEEIIMEQGYLIGKAAGADGKTLAYNRAVQEKSFKIMREANDPLKEKQLMSALFQDTWDTLKPEEQKALGGKADSWINSQLSSLNSPWFRAFLKLDPRPYLSKVKCPALVLNGEKDLQVPPKQSIPQIEKCFKTGGNTMSTIMIMPGLNHLFQKCSTGSPAEYQLLEETFSPEALKVIGDWIVAHTSRTK